MEHSNWKCPKCGLPDISGERIKCPRCGKKRNRWGYWDCRYCGTKGIRGDHKECGNCGHARDRNVKFYLRKDLIEFVDEVSGEDAVRVGREHANWVCPYCSQQNDDSAQQCAYCGSARAESQERYHDVSEPQPEPAPGPPAQKPSKWKQFWKRYSCCGIFAAFFVLLLVVSLVVTVLDEAGSKKIRTADLGEAYWESSIYVEELRTFEGSDWVLPAGARLLRTQTEDYTYVDHYERRSREVWVDDYDYDNDGGWDWDDGGWDDGGWDDYGNGQFGVFGLCAAKPPVISLHYETEWYDEPVYMTEPRTKYYYEYDQWVDARTVTAKGSSDKAPEYGELVLGEKERERTREIKYYVAFMHKDNVRQIECSEEQWQRMIRDRSVTYRILNPLSDPQYLIADQE